MKYISTSEAAELWNISVRRVSMLASEGRISGVVRAGGRWLIPADTPRPADGRLKENRGRDERDYKFCFPLILMNYYSDLQVRENFTPDERTLLEAQLSYERGDMEHCREIAEGLLNTGNNRYVKIGALYTLCFASVQLREFEKADEYVVACRAAVSAPDSYNRELELLNQDINCTLYVDSSYFMNAFPLEDAADYSPEIMPVFSCMSAYSDLIRYYAEKAEPNLSAHSACCAILEQQGYFFPVAVINIYIFLMLLKMGNKKKAEQHLKKAIEIAAEHDCLFSLAGCLTFTPDIARELSAELPEEISEKLARFTEQYSTTMNDYLSFSGRNTVICTLTDFECRLMAYLARDYKRYEIAKAENMPLKVLKNHFIELEKKLGRDPHIAARDFFTQTIG